ncbi:DUF1697 domain-containing protein [Stigmatella sp. ncwal1]|uniref:DUF1697 domain-containing protein n=1 Tax=Stigmatella ashevillensis TaxID=2995309 RepID=A0ABT5DCR7_9BACT|nr:DUF1697 domain-containing protein [Stigmatella ashevillena]MDC0711413.1 DUF1697 domain-containing protein [Stigmatella ashevillena]
MNRLIILLRGINVGGHRKVPMEHLRQLCRELGFDDVESYIQSGNLVLSAPQGAEAAVASLEPAIEQRFGFAVDVIARTARQWADYAAGSPFPDAAEQHPNLLHLALSKQKPKSGAAAALRERAMAGERIETVGDALWVHFPDGVARTKLSPAVFDKAMGSPVTARNWRTVLKLHEMAGGQR